MISQSRALLSLFVACGLTVCFQWNSTAEDTDPKIEIARRTIKQVQEKLAPDTHLAIYDVEIETKGEGFVLTGEVDKPEAALETQRALAAAGISASNEIAVL